MKFIINFYLLPEIKTGIILKYEKFLLPEFVVRRRKPRKGKRFQETRSLRPKASLTTVEWMDTFTKSLPYPLLQSPFTTLTINPMLGNAESRGEQRGKKNKTEN